MAPHLSFVCVDLKLEMYEMGVKHKECAVVLYLGCGVEVEVGVGACGKCFAGRR